ncbi:MAG TPA: FRG domain-containing protein [Candidatus Binatia bacterium]|nr:FRG domain-containing protein [Candidatus Binatia bacterium]
MAVRQIEVRTLGELVDRLTPDVDRRTGRRRDAGVYRGAADADQPLLTALDRLGGIDPPHTKVSLEQHLLRSFSRYSRPYLGGPAASDWELLIAAQHHGVPTRLLDWTYSPLVAAHFATLPCATRNGHVAVWRLDWQRVHESFGFPPLALTLRDLESFGDGDGPLTAFAIVEGRVERPFACMLEPPSLDARIVAQAATFTLCSDISRAFDRFLAEHGLSDALVQFVVPRDAVAYVRDQLDLVNVDERRLFPDLDGAAASIRRYYA